MITRSNYEIWFIDFADGKLSAAQTRELYAFLEVNADLKEEFEIFNAIEIPLDIPETKFGQKDSLKKSVTTSVTTEQLIALLENDLTGKERKFVEEKINENPAIAAEYEWFAKTKLSADTSISFAGKNKLKRGGVLITMNQSAKRFISVAASIAILIAAYFILQSVKTNEKSTAEIPVAPVKKMQKENGNENSVVVQESSNPDKEPVQKVEEGNTFTDNQLKEPKKNKEIKKSSVPLQNKVSFDNSALAENKEMENKEPAKVAPTNYSNVLTNTSVSPSTVKVNDQQSLAAVFSDDELKELRENSKDATATNNTLSSLAKKGIEKIGEAADISIKTSESFVDDSKTFALAFGKKIKIRHTTGE